MGSGTSVPVSKTRRLPTITLDNTLAELYQKSHDSLRIAHLYCGVSSAVEQLSPDFPRNLKYVYLDAYFNDSSPADEISRMSLATKFLSLLAQRDAFISGGTRVVMFHTGREDARRQHDRNEVAQTLDTLNPSQRPKIVFCSGPAEVYEAAMKHGIDVVTSKLVVDGVARSFDDPSCHLRPSLDVEVLWYLNSKEALARSGLPTPVAQVVELERCDSEACRDEWINKQIIEVLDAVRQSEVPFVVKGNQSFGGAGTWIIKSESDRETLIGVFGARGFLRKLLSFINPSNEHLHIGTFLITKMVQDAILDIGLTFFVNTSGSATFLAASEQMIDQQTSSWIGSSIVYSHQEELKCKLETLMNEISTWLHEFGYIGPVGADVLESPDGDLQVVDLNVRTTGSMCLPFLETHFTSRGLDAASSFAITVEESREAFIERFWEDFAEGRMCIIAWYEEKSLGKSFGDVVVGAEDEEKMKGMIERVRRVSGQVTF